MMDNAHRISLAACFTSKHTPKEPESAASRDAAPRSPADARTNVPRDSAPSDSLPLVLIVVNTALHGPLYSAIASVAQLVIAADGAARRIADAGGGVTRPAPHVVVGDLDSLYDADGEAGVDARSSDSHDTYPPSATTPGVATASCCVLRVDDADSTDMVKCMRYAYAWGTGRACSPAVCAVDPPELQPPSSPDCPVPACASPCPVRVLVLGGTGGRFDHTMSALHAIMAWATCFHSLYMLSEGNLLAPVPAHTPGPSSTPGDAHTRTHTHTCVDVLLGVEGPACGVVPIIQPARLWTTGLEWSVSDWPTSMGGAISTCNHMCVYGPYRSRRAPGPVDLRPGAVTIRVTHPVLWSEELDFDRLATWISACSL